MATNLLPRPSSANNPTQRASFIEFNGVLGLLNAVLFVGFLSAGQAGRVEPSAHCLPVKKFPSSYLLPLLRAVSFPTEGFTVAFTLLYVKTTLANWPAKGGVEKP